MVKQPETDQVRGLKAKLEQKKTLAAAAVAQAPPILVTQTTNQHFGRECDHGDIHSQATNNGFSRKPNGNGFFSY